MQCITHVYTHTKCGCTPEHMQMSEHYTTMPHLLLHHTIPFLISHIFETCADFLKKGAYTFFFGIALNVRLSEDSGNISKTKGHHNHHYNNHNSHYSATIPPLPHFVPFHTKGYSLVDAKTKQH